MALVSVITATWQRPRELQRALDSVGAQTHSPIDHIVVADGHDAEAERICAGRARYIELGRNWRTYRGVESRGADPRAMGAVLAKGEYIAYLDDDNEWAPTHLEHALALLEQTNADFVTTQAWCPSMALVVGDGALALGHVDTSTLVHRASCLLKGNWVAIHDPWDDWDLMRRWHEAGLRWEFLPEQTVIHY